MDRETVLIVIGMSFVTYIPRILPIMVLSRMKIPNWFLQWLKYIPAAVLSALLVPGILLSGDTVDISLRNKNLLAAIPCIIVAALTKNLFITVVSGIASMLLLNLLFV